VHCSQELLGDIAKGYNPAEERRAVRDEMTFEELFAVYLESQAKVHKRTWKTGCRRVHALPRQFAAIEESIHHQTPTGRYPRGERAKSTANRTLKLPSKVFNWARQQRPLVRRNFAQSNMLAQRPITEASKLIRGFLKRYFFFLRVPGWLAAIA